MLNARKRQRWDDDYDSDSTTVLSEKEGLSRRTKKALRISAPPSSRASSVTAVTSPITQKCAQLVSQDEFFTLPTDCTQETETLVLPEETDTETITDSSIPVRVLRDFIFYDEADKNRIVPLGATLEDGTSVRAYGLVAALPKDDDDDEEPDPDDDDDDEGEKSYELSLSSVFSYSVDPNPAKPLFWIRTQWAWYILDRPDERYLPVYVDYWKELYSARLALGNTLAAKQLFGLTDDSVTQEELGGAVSLFSTSFTDEEITAPNVCGESTVQDLTNDVQEKSEALWIAFQELTSKKSRKSKLAKDFARVRSTAPPVRQPRGRPPANIERDVLQHRNPTYATEFVRNLASVLCFRFYGQSVKTEDDSTWPGEDLTCDPKTVMESAFSFPSNANSDLDWTLSECRDQEYIDETAYDSYLSAESENYSLKAGDFVVVRGDPKDDRTSWNRKGSGKVSADIWVNWFAQVIFFYESEIDRTPHAHLRWLEHSSRTQLGESGHPRELVLLTTCDSAALTTIINKVDVRYIAPDEPEPIGYPYRAVDEDNFFYRYAANVDGDILCASQFMFPTDAQAFDTISLFGCFTCHLRKSTEQDDCPFIPEGRTDLLLYRGVTYHLYDFAYIASNREIDMNKPFRIGQIVQFRQTGSKPTIVVKIFERYDDVISDIDQEGYKDHKRLIDSQRKLLVSPTMLRGTCSVLHRDGISSFDEWVTQDDHFFVDRKRPPTRSSEVIDPKLLMPLPVSDMRYCDDFECNLKRTSAQPRQPRRMLRALDLYHGAGGLSFGLEKSCAIETCWGIDFSPSAHLTFKKNFPNAIAILQCANEVLRHAIENANGARREPLYPINGGNTPCPPLPQPGEVDIVVCGPPCQGYSVLNSHRRTDDIKNTLVANALSYVDYLRPRFFLMENVQPMLSSRGKVLTPGDIEERIVENAVRKFIVRFLTSRGYQVRVTVLQAGEFGAAQHRARAFFWAARRGEHLPEFPLPTHTWRTKKTKFRDENGGAPLPQVGVQDVIGDLKEWHWKNPKKMLPNPVVPAPNGPVFDAVTYDRKTGTCGYTSRVSYGKPAMTLYQKDLRGDCSGVRYHATVTYVGESVERVCNVPPPDEKRGIEGGLDYRGLDGRLHIWHLTCPHSRAAKGGFGEAKYARVWPDRPAKTVLTRNEPTGKQGRVLHYSQYRVLSGQENARLQGFPDHYYFISQGDDFRDIMRLIGNAVPIPLGYHLGLQLTKSIMAKESELLAISLVKEEEHSLSPEY
ncbi:S-adenosyl-L-methionine-dependent methyltransferase [Calocera viscosa TUFC12733]|uniref:DNA (cytosine-5-)-methyltransferase n=1 Tax=Calocera viscosa (strain TUFC12733) TaxID=1330018 RepID=A0A167R1A8_CALVF|nr:S-adenosyl-L-methionine-dependent methyltransferase [Calocera viscosa TUFC12733]